MSISLYLGWWALFGAVAGAVLMILAFGIPFLKFNSTIQQRTAAQGNFLSTDDLFLSALFKILVQDLESKPLQTVLVLLGLPAGIGGFAGFVAENLMRFFA